MKVKSSRSNRGWRSHKIFLWYGHRSQVFRLIWKIVFFPGLQSNLRSRCPRTRYVWNMEQFNNLLIVESVLRVVAYHCQILLRGLFLCLGANVHFPTAFISHSGGIYIYQHGQHYHVIATRLFFSYIFSPSRLSWLHLCTRSPHR